MANLHVVVTFWTSSGIVPGSFWVPGTPPTVHAVVGKVTPVRAGTMNVICVGVLEVVKTLIPFTTTRMLSMKLPPVIVTGTPPASGTVDGEMPVMNGLRLWT